MELILSHAEEWHVLTDKIAVIGFSAGGHLAACAATLARHIKLNGDRDPMLSVACSLGYLKKQGEAVKLPAEEIEKLDAELKKYRERDLTCLGG